MPRSADSCDYAAGKIRRYSGLKTCTGPVADATTCIGASPSRNAGVSTALRAATFATASTRMEMIEGSVELRNRYRPGGFVSFSAVETVNLRKSLYLATASIVSPLMP